MAIFNSYVELPEGNDYTLTLWSFNIAMENGSFIDLPIRHGDFPPLFMLGYQRVTSIETTIKKQLNCSIFDLFDEVSKSYLFNL